MKDVSLSDIFGLCKGERVAVTGCGGKTSMIYRLARENRESRVLIGTTTRILRPPPDIFDYEVKSGQTPDKSHGVTLFVSGEENGKLLPSTSGELLPVLPFFDYAFLECDGSRGLPLKGWEDYEPVVPEFSTLTVGVCTPWPIGEPLSEKNTLRLDRFREITGACAGDAVTPEHIAAMAFHSNGMFKNAAGRRILFINQVESDKAPAYAREIARLLPRDFKEGLSLIVAGSLRLRRFNILWRG